MSKSTCTNSPKPSEEWSLLGESTRRKPPAITSLSEIYFGGYSSGDPPLPIPNREVKPANADGTAIPSGRVGSRRFSRVPSEKSGGTLFLCPTFCPGTLELFFDVVFVPVSAVSGNHFADEAGEEEKYSYYKCYKGEIKQRLVCDSPVFQAF